MDRARGIRRLNRWSLGAVLVVVLGLVSPVAAQAATSYGTTGPSYSGVTHPPTSDKPQSKLWWNDGSWWAYMWAGSSGWHIERLDRATASWVDTGVLVDSRSTTLADTLWDGSHLYIASHVATVSTISSPKVSKSGQPAKLRRYSYSGGAYTLDAGFPTTISDYSTESMTIDEDSTGVIWATWVQVKGSSTTGYTATTYVNASAVGGTSWPTPFPVPGASNPNPSVDDISAVVAFQRSKIGVMWSDQLTGTVWWAWRNDGTSATAAASWHVGSANRGPHQADDHLNLKTLQADDSGRVFASVKTSLDSSGGSTSQAQLLLLTYKPGTGSFDSTPISTIADCQTRPQVVLESDARLVHVFMTGPSTSVTGCPYAGTPGAIYEKTASMDNPVFVDGRGTPVIEDGSSANVNNVTTSKQPVDATTGMVVLASNDSTKHYWFADWAPTVAPPPPPTPAPTAAFTLTPASGAAPLNVAFTDTSTASPTSWSWDFGDGSAPDTTQNPTHTYTAAGTYTVTLTATNASGSGTATQTGAVVVSPAPAPTAAFTLTPASGTAPLNVAFTDTSTASPTSWSWDFGDASAPSTSQNPSHTYTAEGSYTVTLTAANASGSSTVSQADAVVVSPPPPASSGITVGASTSTQSTSAATAVTLPTPTGLVAGDFLVAEINADQSPTISSTPVGWSSMIAKLSPGGLASTFVYYHVVTDPTLEPASTTWTLSSAQKWGGGVSDFHGVDTANPFDTAAATKVTTSGSTTITVPSVTTVTPDALLVGGLCLNSTSITGTPPTGWTEAWEIVGAQDASLSSMPQPTAGSSGTTTFTLSASTTAAAWVRALRPAA
ncbi:MAG TPA: PKD domain-containing protein [Cellulomonas sp.]|uniref:PKD domain-containing protein n=1 Tax=Cellulomonas sp. TaxID=40001 RepID=UPI002E35DF0B|nr:PKD domain-containing protein [Cellulomonas sp.]HEX5332776.1 PKD domain-containing protein [Cellulomonas sp.]